MASARLLLAVSGLAAPRPYFVNISAVFSGAGSLVPFVLGAGRGEPAVAVADDDGRAGGESASPDSRTSTTARRRWRCRYRITAVRRRRRRPRRNNPPVPRRPGCRCWPPAAAERYGATTCDVARPARRGGHPPPKATLTPRLAAGLSPRPRFFTGALWSAAQGPPTLHGGSHAARPAPAVWPEAGHALTPP